jgi:hypothetical protein
MDATAAKARKAIAIKALYNGLGLQYDPENIRIAPDVFMSEALPILAQRLLDLQAEVAELKAKKRRPNAKAE